KMMPLAIAGGLLALSSAGLPFTIGFLGKALIYESSTHLDSPMLWIATVVAVFTNIFLLYAGLVAGVKPFMGKEKLVNQSSMRAPSIRLWLPPLLLAALGLVFGMAPSLIDGSLIYPLTQSLAGRIDFVPLTLWHGWTPVLFLSIATL